MNFKHIREDILFVGIIESLLFVIYTKGPIPSYFPFPFYHPMIAYFNQNISQFFIILYIPYLPFLLFHITNLNAAIFLGLSILWIPSIIYSLILTRDLLDVLNLPKYHYSAYLPILFLLFVPHTLYELFYFNGSHLFVILSQFFLMYSSIIAGINFYYTGKRKYLFGLIGCILLINVQTFTMSYFLLSLLLIPFSFLLKEKWKYLARLLVLITVSIIMSFIYLYLSFSVTNFPFYNLSLPQILSTDPNYRVFLTTLFSSSRQFMDIISLQNFVGGPYYPYYFPKIIYGLIVQVLFIVVLLPFYLFMKAQRKFLSPIYFSFVAFEILNTFANPFISLSFPQYISIFLDLSYVFNNNTVFFYPMEILGSLLFLLSCIALIRTYERLTNLKVTVNYRGEKSIQKIFKFLHRKGFKAVLCIAIAFILLTPLISYSVNNQNKVDDVQTISFFEHYFENVENASVYFDFSSMNSTINTIVSDSIPISNPGLVGEQTYPLSLAVSSLGEVTSSVRATYLAYLMTTFHFNYFVTNNLSIIPILESSSYFKSAVDDNGIFIFGVLDFRNISNTVLLSSSVSQLLLYVNTFKDFPFWVYSPYLLNMSSVQKEISGGSRIFRPSFYTEYEFFLFTKGISMLIPAQYTDNSYYDNQWLIGYFLNYAQETWSQNIPSLLNYQYQNDINTNYGVIYSNVSNVTLKIPATLGTGPGVLIARILHSNLGGAIKISYNGNTSYINTTEPNQSYFTYNLVGTVNDSGIKGISITNLKGLNAINALMFVPLPLYKTYIGTFASFVNESSLNRFWADSEIASLPMQITVNHSEPSFVYEQEIKLSIVSVENYLNSNMSNILFTNELGNLIPAFVESLGTSTGVDALIWLRLKGEINQTIYLRIFSKNTNLFSSNGFIGEAPNLSAVYGEYFNAPEVFGSGNAWDWVNSFQGWSASNSSHEAAYEGVHVYNGTNYGLQLNRDFHVGEAISIYGWTENNTVIQFNGNFSGGNGGAYGWVGTAPHSVQEYPQWTNATNVYGDQGRFYLFTISLLYNYTAISSISNSTFSASYFTVSFSSITQFIARESINNPQYYSYRFIRTLPSDGMPIVNILQVQGELN